MRKVLLAFTIATILSLSPATFASADLFYTGGITIDSLSATIDVTTQANIVVEYELVNHGAKTESVTLTFSPTDVSATIDGAALSNPVLFEKGAKKKLILSYSLSLSSASYQSIFFNPTLLFNDMANSQRVKSYNVKLILPQGIKRIIHSSVAYDSTVTQNGRLALLWSKQNIYPSPLFVSWSNLDVNIVATKTATPNNITQAGEVIEVAVTIENKSDTAVRNITLKDNFYPGTFEAVAPADEFEISQSELSDPHLYWIKEIDSLGAGETETFTYSVIVKALGLETRLGALVVTVNGIPVSVSNDVLLYSELEGKYQPEAAAESGFPTTYIYAIIGAVAVVAIIISVFALRSRKKA
jgi:hypothetical protein